MLAFKPQKYSFSNYDIAKVVMSLVSLYVIFNPIPSNNSDFLQLELYEHQGSLAKRSMPSPIIANIESNPQDNFKMEPKNGFLIVGLMSIVFVNLLA